MKKKYLLGVAGSPILHSKSPQLFAEMFKKMGVDGSYIRLGVSTPEEISSLFKILNLQGINVTSPFKEEIILFLNKFENNAQVINSVNTIININGTLVGYNTDISGVTDTFKYSNIKIENKKVIILGAGGAARSAAYAVIQNNAKNVVIINRTFSKAESAANQINCSAVKIGKLQEELKTTDIIISCLPLRNTPVKKE